MKATSNRADGLAVGAGGGVIWVERRRLIPFCWGGRVRNCLLRHAGRGVKGMLRRARCIAMAFLCTRNRRSRELRQGLCAIPRRR
jgi:hypothetical protein